MKLNQLLTNKKNVIILIIVLLVISIGVILLVGIKGGGTKKGQNTGDGSSKLEIVDPDETLPETSTDASGDWGDAPNSENSENTEDKKQPEQGQTSNDKNVLKDDVEWGSVY